jgi:hypothetical protein
MKKFSDLTEREVLAVAIASEEEDGRIYMSFAENLAERCKRRRHPWKSRCRLPTRVRRPLSSMPPVTISGMRAVKSISFAKSEKYVSRVKVRPSRASPCMVHARHA